MFEISQIPVFRPLAGESSLEAANRVLNLLESLRSLMSPSRFKSLFGPQVQTPYQYDDITGHTPTWMKSQTVSPVLDKHEAQALSEPELPRMAFCLIWDAHRLSKYAEDLKAHISNYVDANNLSMPEPIFSTHDPRYYSNNAQWRNAICRELDLSSLQVDFAVIRMAYEGSAETIIFTTKMTRPWDEVIEGSRRLIVSEVTFKYTLVPVDEMETTYPYEYDGPLLQL